MNGNILWKDFFFHDLDTVSLSAEKLRERVSRGKERDSALEADFSQTCK